MTQCVPGTGAKSSTLGAPQMNFTSPAGAQSLAVAATAGFKCADQIAAPMTKLSAPRTANVQRRTKIIPGIGCSLARRSVEPHRN